MTKHHKWTKSIKAMAISLLLAPALMPGAAFADEYEKDEKKMTLREARKMFQARFDKIDTDKDGEISRAEFEASQPKFEDIDTDGSNALSKRELRKFLQARKQENMPEKD